MRAELPDPATAPELFDGVLTRRVLAWLVDVVVLGILLVIAAIIGGIAGFFTWGAAWAALLLVLPAIVLVYYAATLGSPKRATLGMQAMDIVLTPTRDRPLDGPSAILHALLFWASFWISWPVSLLCALFTPRRQMIHDLVLGVLMVRRSPMQRHWGSVGRAARRQDTTLSMQQATSAVAGHPGGR